VTKSDQIGTEHLILSILKHKDNLVSKTLSRYEVDYDVYKAELDYLKNQITSELSSDAGDDDPYEEEERARGGAGAQRKQGNVKSKTPVLDNFGRDVTKQAEEGSLDPIIGRENEIERVSQILSRRKKNNPILIGEPGVGKTAIVEGLALRIVKR